MPTFTPFETRNQTYMGSFSDPEFTRTGKSTRCSEPGKMSCYTALIEWCLRERQRKCRRHKKTNWLLRPSIVGGEFQESLASVKRKYPINQFRAFWSATKRYAESTKADALIHKRVAAAVHGLVDFLSVEGKPVPSDVLRDAERLECLLFMGYDPVLRG